VDGELPSGEMREVEALIARDPEAAKLHAELKNTRQALRGNEAGMAHPESREFFWSKIKREIERTAPAEKPQPEPVSIFATLRRLFVPLGAVAALVIVGFIATRQFNTTADAAATQGTVTELADAGAVTYHNYETGTTLVWLSYPADDSAQPKTMVQ
jgi:anti-sigma factor RsiW